MLTLLAQAPAGGQIIDIAAGAPVISPISTINQLVQIGASAVLLIGTLAVLYFLLYGAFSWITAGGEKGKIEEARTMMTQGIIGLIILAAVFVIFGMVLNFLGLRDRFNIGNYGAGSGGGGLTQGTGTTGGTTPTATKCANNVAIGSMVSDGGRGGYCTNGGAANVKCMAPRTGSTPASSVAYYDPCSCVSGSPAFAWTPNCPL